jgi:glycosyltransferase involved in cell wall biosynthesis
VNKPIILTFVGHYLPSNKASGILRVLVNTVDHLCNEFEFKIITRDRDLEDSRPHPGIAVDQWQQVGNAMVYYLAPESSTLKNIFSLVTGTPHDVLYLNSFFDPLTVKVLLNRKLHGTTFKPVIVVPHGEFGWASLKQKFMKKYVFIQLARLTGLYENTTWRVSSEFEIMDILKYMKIKPGAFNITRDLPAKNAEDFATDSPVPKAPRHDGFSVVFLSRIAPEKNLDYALKVLSKVRARVTFDIYGPDEVQSYWKKCQELIGQLPANVTVNYFGSVRPDQVVKTFSLYDLFLLPTGGENYGQVIAECLTAGTPVLISTETPWRNLEPDGLGWDVDLARMDTFVEILEREASLGRDERMKKRTEIKARIKMRLLDPAMLGENRQLFKRHISG